jgi:hypothetical protein
MFRRLIGVVAVVSAGIVLILGSAATQKESPPAFVPTFDWTAPSNAAPGSANVTFALVGARYGTQTHGQVWTKTGIFGRFAANLSRDFQELLAAKGYTVRGPFDTYDEMTFPDKEHSDLVLEPEIAVGVSITGKQAYAAAFRALGVAANCQLTGQVVLRLRESLTREQMWFKKVDVEPPPPSVRCVTGELMPRPSDDKPVILPEDGVLLADEKFSNSLGPVMEAYYKTVMGYAWKHLDPAEMAIVKQQSQQIRTRKVY